MDQGLVLAGEGQEDPADLDLLGVLELGLVVLVVLGDFGLGQLDFGLEVVVLEEDVARLAPLGQLVGVLAGVEVGLDVGLVRALAAG